MMYTTLSVRAETAWAQEEEAAWAGREEEASAQRGVTKRRHYAQSLPGSSRRLTDKDQIDNG